MDIEDITLENCLKVVEAVNAVAKREVMTIDKEERSYVLNIVASALSMASDSLVQFRAKLEAGGEATPVTDEQKLILRGVLHSLSGLS